MGLNYINEVINHNNNKLALLTNSFFKTEKLMEIGKESFAPQPRVMSGILRLVEKDLDESKKDIKEFVIRELFFYDNMKIKNGLKEGLIQYNSMSQREAKSIIDRLEIDDDLLEMKFEIISNKDLERLLIRLDKLYTFI
jgi:16S rRNA A1518/A1519 N6-dimethyltransferase RsmA/KsgA/DIM1 with predicted DNA glycosylase/AP lyase activity